MPDIMNMLLDRDNLFKIGLTACALGISIFVLWGPKLGSRKGNNGVLLGLQNLGLTCFINSLLQALASCPLFIEWLDALKGNGQVTDALLSILTLLCYEKKEEEERDVVSPGELLSALSRHGWSIAPQEQDTHEMFLLLVTTLEEEHAKINRPSKGSLVDALEEDSHEVTSHGDITRSIGPRTLTMSESVSVSKSLVSPFRGYLTSQLQCLTCRHKSSVRYDKFDSLSLHLPSGGSEVKLKDMLEGLVRCEVLDFACESCASSNPTTKATKTVTIGKLPKCLCLHISRTYITPEGEVYKRDNYVDFPEFLSMTNYTQGAREYKISESNCGGVLGGGSNSGSGGLVGMVQGLLPSSPSLEGNNNTKLPSQMNGVSQYSKHLYRLKAVVEHKGSVENGHFVTYRRGPLRSSLRHRSCSSRWYYTSDAEVRKSSMCDALLANAYLIFYERCSQNV